MADSGGPFEQPKLEVPTRFELMQRATEFIQELVKNPGCAVRVITQTGETSWFSGERYPEAAHHIFELAGARIDFSVSRIDDPNDPLTQFKEQLKLNPHSDVILSIAGTSVARTYPFDKTEEALSWISVLNQKNIKFEFTFKKSGNDLERKREELINQVPNIEQGEIIEIELDKVSRQTFRTHERAVEFLKMLKLEENVLKNIKIERRSFAATTRTTAEASSKRHVQTPASVPLTARSSSPTPDVSQKSSLWQRAKQAVSQGVQAVQASTQSWLGKKTIPEPPQPMASATFKKEAQNTGLVVGAALLAGVVGQTFHSQPQEPENKAPVAQSQRAASTVNAPSKISPVSEMREGTTYDSNKQPSITRIFTAQPAKNSFSDWMQLPGVDDPNPQWVTYHSNGDITVQRMKVDTKDRSWSLRSPELVN